MTKFRLPQASFGIVQYVAFPEVLQGEGPIYETIHAIALDGTFEAIETTWIKDTQTRKKVSNLLSYAGLRVSFNAGPPYSFQHVNIASLDRSEREKSVATAKKLVDDAYYLNAEIHGVVSGPDPGITLREEGRKVLIDSLIRLSEYAHSQNKEKPLVISLEPVDRDIHRKGLIGPIADAITVAKKIKEQCPNFGLTLDLSHLPQLGEKIEDAVPITKGFLVNVHIGNSVVSDSSHPLYGDEHPRIGFAQGSNTENEVVRFFRELRKTGFFQNKPIVSQEVKPQSGEDPWVLIALTKRQIRRAWEEAFRE